MSTVDRPEAPPEAATEPATRPRRGAHSRHVVGAVILAAFCFWLGARLGPLTAVSPGSGMSQGTWLPAPEAYIGGAVSRPGLYPLASNARLADLLRQAGGPVRNADLAHLNLATPVHDGETVTIPRQHGKSCPNQ